MAFNDALNDGYVENASVEWRASSLLITSDDAFGMVDAARGEVALALAALEAPARRVTHAGRGLRVAHQHHRAGAQLAQQRRIVGAGGGVQGQQQHAAANGSAAAGGVGEH